ncbi:MAG: IS21-like element helper ATPase IstB [Sphaerochaetaceae bacterium]|nr:IS21-like element helper ATPase IstB [Sphaerochaetaceae bacterium]
MRTSKKELKHEVTDLSRRMFFSKATLETHLPMATVGELDFLRRMLLSEQITRTSARRARYVKQAGFPVLKSFEGYDFSSIQFPRLLNREQMLSIDFIHEKKVLLFYGGCGSGKTHAMTALGVMACNADLKVKFFTVSQLVMLMKKAHHEGTLEKFLASMERFDLLCLDEFGYLPLDLESGQLLFQLIASAYERKSLILTTNLPFNAWGPLFADEQLAAAIIDRIIHYGHLIKTGDKDWRLSHSLMID